MNKLASIELITRRAIAVVDGPANVGRKAVAAQFLKANTVINEFSSPVFRYPTMHTVCLTKNVHVAPTFGAECISHACGINTNVDMIVQPNEQSIKVVVSRDVICGEDLYFNYNSTEWTMSCPFECSCQNCLSSGKKKMVQGFSFLSLQEQDELMTKYVSPYIRSLVLKQRAQEQQIEKQKIELTSALV